MTSYNHSSSYNRTFERRVIEGGSGTSPTLSSSMNLLDSMKTMSPTSLGGGGGAASATTIGGATGLGLGLSAGSGSGFTPYNYQFGTTTSGSYHASDNDFMASMDVSAFNHEDLKITTVGTQIVIEGKHGEKQDSLGTIERHFVRKFALPRNCHPDTVSSTITADGMLTVSAHAPKIKENSPARAVPIKIVATSGTTAGTSATTHPSNGTTHNIQQQQQPSTSSTGQLLQNGK